eukprot:Gregarina_sp_Poly_1__9840@NODE_632_length_7054_cov_68_751968_g483_i0_p1_GENE_NODE_632_length_7054_cov_68_751968_g483_i0NODE_632_length_7054_cov_68_751968_g483_i0_p1_ORF_typecomplete_len975_score222_87FtsJ/PF01728_19/7_1e53Spb1_C/PF07780_12/5_5e03Spb1_C/PF07780_12/1_8e04Spb1_C/PF07780_12/1_8e04Spb1_C/PF07780_12/7_2e49DUF3381/PF11861_8/1_8e28DUF3381/PF11861_8/4_6e03DUF3381/PF11861_8/1_2e04DUF3381/PF11861_8/1_8e04DUF3381/PF11861_8/1_8e04Methyltrans_Mon/PF14314_6/0_0008Methyltr_RsmBF/PF01189_17/0_25
MGKKAKVGKSRKDHFYALAKQQGFRARSSFKLSQLAQKFALFDSCLYVIDLCAAPGGWMQVASQEIPVAGHVFGVDLVPISPLPKCTSIQADITTDRCEKLLRREMNVVGVPELRVDLVLHDGAPNVGADWHRDAYVQNELVLKSLQLAVKFLRPGGRFVTKVFRSTDYTKLLYVFQQLFSKVQATKPQASRNVSAEIFVVCHNFQAPKRISPELFDLNKVFEHVEDAQNRSLGTIAKEAIKAVDEKSQINQGGLSAAIKLAQKKRRDGYDEGDDYRICSVKQFFESANAAQVLVTHHKIVFSQNEEFDKSILENSATTEEVLEFCEDLKVLGKPSLEKLLKWRKKILSDRMKTKLDVAKSTQTIDAETKLEAEEPKNVSEIEEELDTELNRLVQKEAKQKLKIVRKQRAKLRKLEMKRKIAAAVFQPESKDPDLFSGENAEFLDEEPRMVSIEESWEPEVAYDGLHVSVDEPEDSDKEDAEDVDYVTMLERELDLFHQEQKELAILKGLKGKERKKKETRREQKLKEWAAEMEDVVDNIEKRNLSVLTKNAESSDDEDHEVQQASEPGNESENDSDGQEAAPEKFDSPSDADEVSDSGSELMETETDQYASKKEDNTMLLKSRVFFSDDFFQGLNTLEIAGKLVKKNDAKKEESKNKATAGDSESEKATVSENEVESANEETTKDSSEREVIRDSDSVDDSADNDIREISDSELPRIPLPESQRKKLKRKAENKRKEARELKKAKKEAELFAGMGSVNEDLEGSISQSKQHVIQEVPREQPKIEKPQHKEDLAEVQALGSLMAKKKSRMDLMDGLYNRWAFEDDEALPEWFKEDDEAARIPELPVSKELMDEYRRKLKEIAERPIRKVAEAKARKKIRQDKRMATMKAQAAHIAESSELSERAKAESINKLMKKARRGVKTDKSYIVARGKGGSTEVGPRSKKAGSRKLVDRRLKADKRGMRAVRNKQRKRKR